MEPHSVDLLWKTYPLNPYLYDMNISEAVSTVGERATCSQFLFVSVQRYETQCGNCTGFILKIFKVLYDVPVCDFLPDCSVQMDMAYDKDRRGVCQGCQ